MWTPNDTWRKELEDELKAILAFWMEHTLDDRHGGFIGKLDNNNDVDVHAPKGSVLNSRILYAFSSASLYYNDAAYRQVAARAYDYIVDHFIDKKYGGVYWSTDALGNPLDTKKQVYATAFAVYGLSEYYKATGNLMALQQVINLYETLEKYSHDKVHLGYIEALTRYWQPLEDLRLSSKDFNEKKSMNTHLHVLEAYANLYTVWPNENLKKNIEELIGLFLQHIIDPLTNHLVLFFDEEWNPRSQIVSYGHDIEAAWLVQEAAEIIGNNTLIEEVKQRSIAIAKAAEEGLDKDGGIWYEKEGDHLVKEKHWWPQAEALVGFYNTWQNTGDEHFLELAKNNWKFIQQHIIDHKNGEWFWGMQPDGKVMEGEDKAGMWKCPYHNGRACLELVKRIT